MSTAPHEAQGTPSPATTATAAEYRALLFTDIVESTALVERLGDAAATALWATHDRLARDLLPRWHGREIDRTDGFLLLFDAPTDALGYAFDYHRALRTLATPMYARAGLHYGPVILHANETADVELGAKPLEVGGLAKPTAARVMALARGGQTLLTHAARETLGASDLRVQSHGHWCMKGIEDPIELFEASDSDATLEPPPDGEKAWRVVRTRELWLPVREVPHSLPAERDAFVGRRTTLQELRTHLEGATRLLSVLGIGGTGKTRLAIHFGWTHLGHYPGGVWFCDLSQARDADGIVSAVARGLGVPPGTDEPVEQLAAAIAGRGRCLVILDNFEQVTRHADATLGRWLDVAAEVQFLVTTREVLGLPGERVFALAPLPEADAADLFARRAEIDGTDAHIGELMRLLDGLPLAIELAAARVRVMPPATLLARMRERFDVLASPSTRRDRQATMRTTLDWSWELLSPVDKLALAQLSVFEGGFTLEAAEAVLEFTALGSTPWPAGALHSLVDKSLVRALPEARFDLLLCIQDYAAEHFRDAARFTGSGPRAVRAACERHCAWYAARGEAGATANGCADLDNVIAACRRAVAWGDARLAADALEGAWAGLRYRGPFSTGVALAADVAGLTGMSADARARVELVAGGALASAGRTADAQAHFERSLQLAREAGVAGCEARALAQLGYQELWAGRLEEARARYRVAVDLARQHGEHEVECSVLNGFAFIADQLGQSERSREYFEEALALARRYGDRRSEGSVLGNLASLLAFLGRLDEARPCYEQSLTIARELGDREREGNALGNLGMVLLMQGQLDPARAQCAAALRVARDIGHARLECLALCNLGLIDEAAERPEPALASFEAAVAIADELGERRSSGQFRIYLGRLHARAARYDAARTVLETGEALLREAQDLPNLALLLCTRAEALALAGIEEAATAALRAAESLAAEVDAGPESELGAALTVARERLATRASS
jgi:predicted ATPase/class 3 adenylate cyclase/Tfp pilus assembly protein PilF